MAGDADRMRRTCPRDHAALEEVRLQEGRGAPVDVCPDCGGMFLDKNELGKITSDRKLNAYLRDEVGLDSDSALVCPACGGVMDEETVPIPRVEADARVGPGSVVVDVCLTCFGIWLDKGELDRLRARRNRDDVVRPEGKDAELAHAGHARGRQRSRGASAQGRGVGGAVRRKFLWLDDAMGEIVRRYL